MYETGEAERKRVEAFVLEKDVNVLVKRPKMECKKFIPPVLDENRWLFVILSQQTSNSQ